MSNSQYIALENKIKMYGCVLRKIKSVNLINEVSYNEVHSFVLYSFVS